MSGWKKLAAASAGGFSDPFWIYQYSNENNAQGSSTFQAQNADQLASGSTIMAFRIRPNSGQTSGDEIPLPTIDVDGNIVGSTMPYFYYSPTYTMYLGALTVVSDPDEVWLTGFTQAPASALMIARLDYSNETSISLDSVKEIYSTESTDYWGSAIGNNSNFVHIGSDYYVSGRSYHTNGFYYTALAKFNSSDVNQWSNQYRAAVTDGANSTNYNSCTTDGTSVYTLFNGYNNSRFVVTKINSSGTVQWSKYYDTPFGDPKYHGIAYNPVSGDIVVAIQDKKYWHGGNANALFVASLSTSNGNASWGKVWGNSGTTSWDANVGENVHVTSSGNIVVQCTGNGGVSNSKPAGANGPGPTITVVLDGSNGSLVRIVCLMTSDYNPTASLEPDGGRLTLNDNMIRTITYDKASSTYGKRWLAAQFPLDGSITSGSYTMTELQNEVMYLFEMVAADYDDDTWSVSGTSQTPTVTSKAVTVDTATSSYTLASWTNNDDAIVAIT